MEIKEHDHEWIDITTVGSDIEKQICVNCPAKRHRVRMFNENIEFEWIQGDPIEK